MPAQQHTPGPWTLCAGTESDGTPIEMVRHESRPAAIATVPALGERDEANARLIAAAPELLEAARHMVWWTDTYATHPWFLSLDESQRDEYQRGYEAARAAIAKTEGRAE